jgi:type IV pilus assembly protein PilE
MINNKGYLAFSLVELLLVLVIIAALFSIACPAYIGHMVKVRRSNAAVVLVDLASRLEQYYSDSHSYVDVTLEDLRIRNDDFYQFEITQSDETGFLIKAIPVSVQARQDKRCGALIFDNLGNRSVDGSGVAEDCW